MVPSGVPRSFVQIAAERIHSNGEASASYYEILGVDRQADSDALADAYGRLRQRYHPERNETDPLAREIVRLLDSAYATLIDPERRRGYDASLTNGLSVNGHALTYYTRETNGSHDSYSVIVTETSAPPAPGATAEPTVGPVDGTGRQGRARSSRFDRNLTEGSIPRNLWFLAWPQIIEGVLNVLDQMVDLFWAGRGFGSKAIAGIGVAQNYTGFIMTGRQGLDTGMQAMVSRAIGA